MAVDAINQHIRGDIALRHACRTFIGVIGISAMTACAVQTAPVTQLSRSTQADLDRRAMFYNQEPAYDPITLYDAMARAVKYNLERRVKAAEEALELNRVDAASYNLLPRLSVGAGFSNRDKEDSSVSRSISTQQQSLEASKSEDRGVWRADSTLSWNMLDFGVSYFEARQNNDRAYVAQQRTRKVVHNLLQDVRFAYWRAVAAQTLSEKIRPVIERAENALENAYIVEKENLQPVLQTLQFQKTLLEIVRLLESLRDELDQAHTELRSLINLDPRTELELATPGDLTPPLELMKTAVVKLENIALASRPELFEADYNERISVDEVHKSMISLFPGLELRASKQYISNSFTVNKNWIEAGAAFSLNLIDLASGPSKLDLAKAQVAISNSQRLALSMAVLSQVRLSHQQYVSLVTQYDRARKLRNINKRIADHLKKARGGQAASEIQEIRAETAAITAELDQFKTYAALQNSLGRVYASVGLDPLPQTLKNEELSTLSAAIESKYTSWKTNGVPTIAAKAPGKTKDSKISPTPASNSFVDFLSWFESLFN